MDHSSQSAFTSDEMAFFGLFEDDVVVAAVAQQARAVAAAAVTVAGNDADDASSAAGGSRVGRIRNIERGFDDATNRLTNDYFVRLQSTMMACLPDGLQGAMRARGNERAGQRWLSEDGGERIERCYSPANCGAGGYCGSFSRTSPVKVQREANPW
jgi:hypothetical protein